MFSHTKFPDVIVFPDGTIRLVTRAAKELAYSNTNIGVIFSLSTAKAVPDYLAFDGTIPQMFEDDGMTVKWERQPVFYYRSKKRVLPKAISCENSTDDYDRHRARFVGMDVEQYRKQCRTNRAYARFRKHHHKMQQEAAEKRKGQDRQQE